MSRTAFKHLVAVSEPFWDALAEAAFQRRFHRPRSYRHPQTSSVDHTHRLLAAILLRRRAVTMTFLAQLLGVNRTNLSIQYQDAKRILDLHRILVTPIPGSPARTWETTTRPNNPRGNPSLTVSCPEFRRVRGLPRVGWSRVARSQATGGVRSSYSTGLSMPGNCPVSMRC